MSRTLKASKIEFQYRYCVVCKRTSEVKIRQKHYSKGVIVESVFWSCHEDETLTIPPTVKPPELTLERYLKHK